MAFNLLSGDWRYIPKITIVSHQFTTRTTNRLMKHACVSLAHVYEMLEYYLRKILQEIEHQKEQTINFDVVI